MNTYKLVNPVILGQMNTEYRSENAVVAAQQFWNDLSTHISGNVPHFYFSLQQQGGNKKVTHFKVSEKVGNNKIASFSIDEFKPKLSEKALNEYLDVSTKFQKKTMNIIEKQVGGADDKKDEKKDEKKEISKPRRNRYDEKDSSSDCSDSDYDCKDYFDFRRYRRLTQPISYWWYNPYMYRVKSVFTPTFVAPIVPYTEIWVPYN